MGGAGGGSKLNLFIKIDIGNGFLLPDVDSHTSVEQLKVMIGERLGGMSGMFMRLFVDKDKELSSTKHSLHHYRIPDKCEIVVKQTGSLASKQEIGVEALPGMFVQTILRGLGLRPAAPTSNAHASLVQGEKTVMAASMSGIAMRMPSSRIQSEDSSGEFPPAILMSQEKSFNIIYGLLSHDDDRVVAAAWRLLDRLPAASSLCSSFTGKNPDFASLLPAGTGYRLVYALQLLESLCQTERDEWCAGVVAVGLVDVLSKLVKEYSSESPELSTSALSKEDSSVADSITRLLAVRTLSGMIPAAADGLSSDSKQLLLTALAEALSCVSQVPRPTAEDMEMSKHLADSWRVVAKGVDVHNVIKDFDSWVVSVLVTGASDQIRAQAMQCLSITGSQPESFERLCRVAVNILPEANSHGLQAVQLISLLESFAKEPKLLSETLRRELVTTVVELIRKRSIVEDSTDPGNEDWCLCALLSLLTALLTGFPALKASIGESFLSHLFWNCLFALPNKAQIMDALQPPKCKTDSSRMTAMRLLTELCRECGANFSVVSKFVWQQCTELAEKHRDPSAMVGASGKPRGPIALTQVRKDGGFSTASDSWMLSQQADLRSRAGFVGLQNLGATCYMNSLLQQLLFAPGFADEVLKAPMIPLLELMGGEQSTLPDELTVQSSPIDATGSGGEVIEGKDAVEKSVSDPNADHLLAQFQLLICNLKYSNRKFYNTRPFALANRDMDGNAINTGMQQDAIEYFNSLFDRLEFFCGPDKENHRFLRDIFGGTLSNQLICKDGCTHQKEREEPFYSISVDIKNKANLYKALELYVEGELLEGENAYKCDECDAKRPTLKRAVLKDLPKVLVVHLKRFEFSYETLTHSKLNQYFEFPEELDVFPFTGEGVAGAEERMHPDAHYQYRLRGVVIHSGGASAGHYYSLIRGDEDGAWREFNDSTVRAFDFGRMKEEAFGGSFPFKMRDENGMERVMERERSHNAYILVYEKREAMVGAEEEKKKKETATTSALVERVLQDNVSNLHGRYMSSYQYYNWLWDFLTLYSSDSEKEQPQLYHDTLSLTLYLLLHVMGRSRDSVMGNVWSGHVARLCRVSKHASEWLFRRLLSGGVDDKDAAGQQLTNGSYQYLYDFLCRCPRPRTRAAFVEIVKAAMEQLSGSQAGWWSVADKLPPLDPQSVNDEEAATMAKWLEGVPAHVQLMDRMLNETPELLGHTLQFMSHWFALMRVFAETGVDERRYLVARDAVKYLIELVTLEGRFSTNKGKTLALDAAAVQRNVRNTANAFGCVAVIARSAAVPSEQQVQDIIGENNAGKLLPGSGGGGSGSGGGGRSLRGGKDKRKGSAEANNASGVVKKLNPYRAFKQGEALLELPTHTWKEIIGRDMVQRICDERLCLTELLEVMEYLVWEDVALNDYFMLLLVDGMKRCKTVESLGGYLTCFDSLLHIGDSLQGVRVKHIGSFLMQMVSRSINTRSKAVAAAEVTKYWYVLVTAARTTAPTHPIRKFVLSKEREMDNLLVDLGVKPPKLDF